MRKFYLQNRRGERYDLNGALGIYASEPGGLGFSLSPIFADLSHGFFASVADANDPQGTPGFKLTFTRHAYTLYQKLIDWLAAEQNAVTLCYDPTGSQEYMMDITIASLVKTELNALGWLECPCSFYARSPWYRPVPTSLTVTSAGTDSAMRYDYRYTEDLIYGSDATSSISGILSGAGHIPGALELTYHGAATNPRIRLTGEISGKTYGICAAETVLTGSDLLQFSSRHNDSHIRKVSAAGHVTDLLDTLDLSTEPFFHLPITEPCTLSLEADTVLTGSVELTIFYYYRSV